MARDVYYWRRLTLTLTLTLIGCILLEEEMDTRGLYDNTKVVAMDILSGQTGGP